MCLAWVRRGVRSPAQNKTRTTKSPNPPFPSISSQWSLLTTKCLWPATDHIPLWRYECTSPLTRWHIALQQGPSHFHFASLTEIGSGTKWGVMWWRNNEKQALKRLCFWVSYLTLLRFLVLLCKRAILPCNCYKEKLKVVQYRHYQQQMLTEWISASRY
jgi:hypothetical protein